jgi:hypothetical protein
MPLILLLALAGYALTRLARKLSPWMAARRPVGCNVCMSVWAPLAFYWAPAVVLELAAAAGACLLLLDYSETIAPKPIDLENLP